jgi:hypothetical protein
VFQHKPLNGNVGILLLYLADHMRADLTVSVPRTQIAADLNIHPARVTERIKAAHDAGLLDTIVHGRERTTAVYKAMFPHREVQTGGQLRGTGTRTSQNRLRGTDGGSTINYSPDEVTSPNVLCFTGKAPPAPSTGNHSSEEEEKLLGQRQLTVKPLGNAVDRETPRSQVLTAIQRAAAAEYGIYSDAGDELLQLLEEHHGEEVSGQVANYWTVPRKATDRYEAGVWLNKMLATLRKEGLTA